MKNKLNNAFYFLPMLSAVLLWLGWPPLETPYVLFVALIPLLWFDHLAYEHGMKRWQYRLLIYAGLLLWNLLTTWWVWNATEAGAIAMLVFNSLLMSLAFYAHNLTRRLTANRWGYIPLVIYWTGMEYFHFNWDLSWPWLTLGNGFSTQPFWVGWYEVTGTLGGTVWIWAVNILLFTAVRNRRYIKLWIPAAVVALPVFVSILLDRRADKPCDTCKIIRHDALLIQPNIDPYSEKFGSMAPMAQLDRMLQLIESKLDENTHLVIMPETAITESIDEDYSEKNEAVQTLRRFLKQHPGLTIISGADTYHFFKKGEKRSATARKANQDLYYDAYNSAILIDSTRLEVYHKTKLVPGVELMPYPRVFGFLASLAIDLGGTSGSLGRQGEAKIFEVGDLKTAPVICYESIYGDYVADYIRKGAQVILVMTNDGWWDNTPGYKQHFQYGRLRAIETRKPILRAANTGISGYIDIHGNVHDATSWWEPAAVKVSFTGGMGDTIYVKYGDLVGKGTLVLTILLLVWSFFLLISLRIKIKREMQGG